MYKKLDENIINEILEAGIEVFADKGLEKANINTIARNAGVSVGVIYKYYGDKDGFFLACVRHSLELLDSTLQEAVEGVKDVRECIERIVRALIKQSREHASYNAMYNEITSGSCRRYAAQLADEIEKRTAALYTKLFETVGAVSSEDAGMFAFFFDNLLMMLQFSYSCDYYRERMKIFCGEDASDKDEKMTEMFMKFMDGVMKGEPCST